jgi:5-deoxy-glucuronate isomerase
MSGPPGEAGCLPRHRRAGSAAQGPWAVDLRRGEGGWRWCSLRVLELVAGGSQTFATGPEEVLVLPLTGSCSVRTAGGALDLSGRADVFSGATDFAYLPAGTSVTVFSSSGGRFAVPGAPAGGALPGRRQPASATPVELRGAGNCSRRVVNYCMPGTFEAEALLVCEVLTPGGNWSSYPPHKHDEASESETALEEIYYFEVATGPDGQAGPAYQRVYGPPGRPADLLAEVRSGDVVLIPHGYHGPSMAAPGYDLYYLNVMAGPGRRAWLATDDPAHAWVRGTWAAQAIDPRLSAAGVGEPGDGSRL